MRKKWLVGLVLVIGVVATVAVGLTALITEAQAAPCRCPLIYAPVQCDHGRVYPNLCVANCHNAKNCVPLSPAL